MRNGGKVGKSTGSLEELLARIAPVADRVGKADFYPALLSALAAHLKADLPMMMRYSAQNAPEYIIHAGLQAEHMELYRRGLYRVDPIYRLCRNARGQGVMDLTEISTPEEMSGDYFKIFLRLTGMADDLAILLPVGQASLGLVFERRVRFRREEIAEMRALFPLLDSLHRLHQTLSGPAGSSRREDPGLPPIDYRKAVDGYLHAELTPRERDIVGLVLLGYPTAKIAARLKLSVNTIKNHKKRMYNKLDITTERELFLGFVNFLFEDAGTP
jgi:DNA-binding CsgD family transcriptional regulator